MNILSLLCACLLKQTRVFLGLVSDISSVGEDGVDESTGSSLVRRVGLVRKQETAVFSASSAPTHTRRHNRLLCRCYRGARVLMLVLKDVSTMGELQILSWFPCWL